MDHHQCTCYECIYSDEDLRLLPPDISNLLHYEFPDNSSILRQVSSKSPACLVSLDSMKQKAIVPEVFICTHRNVKLSIIVIG